MSPHRALQSCCSKPRFNSVGGVDDGPWLRLPAGIGLRRIRAFFQTAVRPLSAVARKIGRAVGAFAAFLARKDRM